MFWRKKYVDDVHEIPGIWKFIIVLFIILLAFFGVCKITEAIDNHDIKSQNYYIEQGK